MAGGSFTSFFFPGWGKNTGTTGRRLERLWVAAPLLLRTAAVWWRKPATRVRMTRTLLLRFQLPAIANANTSATHQVNGARRRRDAWRRWCMKWQACRLGRRSRPGFPGRRWRIGFARAQRSSVGPSGWTTWTGSTAEEPSGQRRMTWTSCAGPSPAPGSRGLWG